MTLFIWLQYCLIISSACYTPREGFAETYFTPFCPKPLIYEGHDPKNWNLLIRSTFKNHFTRLTSQTNITDVTNDWNILNHFVYWFIYVDWRGWRSIHEKLPLLHSWGDGYPLMAADFVLLLSGDQLPVPSRRCQPTTNEANLNYVMLKCQRTTKTVEYNEHVKRNCLLFTIFCKQITFIWPHPNEYSCCRWERRLVVRGTWLCLRWIHLVLMME